MIPNIDETRLWLGPTGIWPELFIYIVTFVLTYPCQFDILTSGIIEEKQQKKNFSSSSFWKFFPFLPTSTSVVVLILFLQFTCLIGIGLFYKFFGVKKKDSKGACVFWRILNTPYTNRSTDRQNFFPYCTHSRPPTDSLNLVDLNYL